MTLLSEGPGKRAIFMTFREENLVNLRGRDVFSVYDEISAELPDLEGALAERVSIGADSGLVRRLEEARASGSH